MPKKSTHSIITPYMAGENTPRNKIGYEGEPDYSTLRGAQDQDQGTIRQVSPRDRATSVANSAEQAVSQTEQNNNPSNNSNPVSTINNFTKGKKSRSQKKQGILSGGLKKATPLIGIAAAILVFLLFISSPFSLGSHLIENIKSAFNSLFSTNSTVAKESYRAMLTNPADSGYAKIGQDNCDDFGTVSNIEYSLCPEGATDPDVQAYYRAKNLESSTLATTSLPITTTNNVFKFTDQDGAVHIIDSTNFDNFFDNNANFNDALTRASLAWTGTFSGWFDDTMQQLMKKLNTTRNAFEGYYEDINDQLKSEETYRKIIEAVNDKSTMTHTSRERLVFFSGGGGNTCGSPQQKGLTRASELDDTNTAEFIEITGIEIHDWCTTPEPPPEIKTSPCQPSDNGYRCPVIAWYNTLTSTIVSTALSEAEEKVRAYLPEMVNSLYNGNSIQGSAVGNTCASFYGISYFSAITAATRLQQTADFATKALESIDKTRAGSGSESPIHQLSQHLSEQNTYEYLPSGSDVLSTSTTNRPALNASGLSWITTGSAVDTNDANIQKLSLEGIMKGFVLDANTVLACNLSSYAGTFIHGLVSLITSPSGPSDHLFSDTNGEYLFLNKDSTDKLVNDAITRAAYGLIFNPCTQPGGEDVGNCLALGSHYYFSKNHQLSGGSPADQTKLEQFLRQQRVAVARTAELERTNRSPFDISSPYTFLGSIVHQVTSYNSTFATSSVFASIGSIVSSSISSLSPTTSALEDNVALTNIGNCQYLGSGDFANTGIGINAVGDAFCVPYIITDVDPAIRNMSPTSIEQKIRDLSGFDGSTNDGNPKIRQNSNFARYITYCSNRYSTFGIIDANILQDFVENRVNQNFFYNLLRAFVGKERTDALGFGGYEMDVNKEAALGWATGKF